MRRCDTTKADERRHEQISFLWGDIAQLIQSLRPAIPEARIRGDQEKKAGGSSGSDRMNISDAILILAPVCLLEGRR
jgi:hypothetical protein